MWRLVALLVVLVVGAGGAWAWIVLSPTGGSKKSVTEITSAGSSVKGKGQGPAGSQIAGMAAAGFDPDKELQPGELVVINPPQNFNDVTRRLNFTVIERFTFQGLGFAVARVRAPAGMALQAARQQLAA